MVGIVIRQHFGNGQAMLCQLFCGVSVRIAAGGIGGTVGAVAAHADDASTGDSREASGGSQSNLLIPSAQSLAYQMDNGFTACKVSKFFAVTGMGAENISKECTVSDLSKSAVISSTA